MKRLLYVLAIGLILVWGLSADIGARANFETVPSDAGEPVPGGDDHGWGGENNGPSDLGNDAEGTISPAPPPAPTFTPFSSFWSTWIYDRWLQSQPDADLKRQIGSRDSDPTNYRRVRYSVRD